MVMFEQALSKLKAAVDAADAKWEAHREKADAAKAASDAAQEKLVFANALKAAAYAANAEWEAHRDKSDAAKAAADAAQEKLELAVADARREWRLRNAVLS